MLQSSPLLRCSSLSSPRWYHLQSLSSDVFLVSHLDVSNPQESCFTAPLPDVIVSHVVGLPKCVAACPSAHFHFCQFQFLHMGASHWYCLHPVGLQHSWLNDHLVDISLHVWSLFSHMTADIFLPLFHLHCVLLLTSVFILPSLCRVLPRYVNSVTCGSWSDCILTLPNGVPFRHMYSFHVFVIDTFIHLFSKASLHSSSFNSST